MSKEEYFIRHTEILEILQSDLESLFNEGVFGIHFSSQDSSRSDLLDESRYVQTQGKTAIRYLKELARDGGYVWSEYNGIPEILIGYVNVGSKIEIKEYTPTKNLENFPHDKLYLKCLKLDKLKIIKPNELLMLKARRPRQGTFVHWKASLGKIKDALENDLPLSVTDWSDLTPDLQEIVSFEYLREVGINNWKIKYLLMPIGRTMKDIDIYALNDKNEKVFVQVTNQGDDKLKLEFLSNYVGEKVYISSRDISQYQNTNIHYLATDTIFKWLKTKQIFLDNLMC